MKPWIVVFIVVQAAGYLTPQFAPLHTSPLLLVIGIILLLPGSAATIIPGLDNVSAIWQVVLISGINAVSWYVVLWRRRRAVVER